VEREVEAAPRIYLVELGRGRALDCRRSNGFRHLNHSCSPNAYMRTVGTRLEIYTLRVVRAGEELTIDYGATPHRGGMVCRCGSPNCRAVL
jgi:SET domain-containing protein